MNYSDMIDSKIKFRKRYVPTADINATKVWNVPITDSDRENYAPFLSLTVHNKSGKTIQVALNSVGLGDDSLQLTKDSYFLLPENVLEVNDIPFYTLAIKNLDTDENIDIATGSTEFIEVIIKNW